MHEPMQALSSLRRRLIAPSRLLPVVGAALCLVLVAVSSAHAVQPDEIMSDPAQEARARDLSRGLRCMVCQNQSIDDSSAPLARDLRLLVRERIASGDSDQQVLDFLVARYGDFVLLKPPFERSTLPLWLLTPLLLAGGGLALWGYSRRRAKAIRAAQDAPPRLSEEEEARLAKLMAAERPAGEETRA
ncbi:MULTISPECIES: cytochrome c-type biogenesis protein [unclassified Nitrobacter]|nr:MULTISPECIES: cytochrome c-type biogenesis protein [unclassified Nitrobacter]MCB1391982.1 cytochrome c-type biogenesis protein CcmH [Nitrobacter sp.]MCV0385694.1 cytochrome c-type biogenesis protein CcmH [Nitrobacter sp.]